MNRCIKCGRNIKNAETTSDIEFCKYCSKYEQQLAEKDKEKEELRDSFIKLKEELNKQYDRCDRARKKAINQLAEKDKKIRELKEEIEDETDFKNEYYKYWQDLKKEMTQKNKEIGQLKFNLANQRHHICEKIREWCEQNEFEVENADQSSDCVIYTYKQLFKKLNQIEKGEFNETKKK